MYHTDWVAEFRQKLAANDGTGCGQEDSEGEEPSPLIRRWLMLADQLLSTDAGEVEPA